MRKHALVLTTVMRNTIANRMVATDQWFISPELEAGKRGELQQSL